MKPPLLQKADALRSRRAMDAVERNKLRRMKASALRASPSARNEHVADVDEAFGFFPRGLQGVIIHWPKL